MMDRTIGRTISHYTILDRLGAGGMGVVYKARDSKLDRLVAVKFLPPHLGADETARERFIAEAKAASALDHPNIATIFEIDETADVGLFIVMAYYPGVSLSERIRRSGPLPLPVALDFAVQAGEGLAEAHEHHIVHRDIKPGNMMVTDEGIIKILDFGLAIAQSKGLVQEGSILGTLRFMSPERLSYGPVDHRCDIWALGVVLYNMITARLPFDCADTMELMDRIKASEPAPFSAPTELRSIILRALAKHPAGRYQQIGDLVAECRDLQQRLPGLPDFGRSVPVHIADAAMLAPPRGRRVESLAAGERRQLTMLSCELADWPTFAARLDSEQLRQVLVDFHTICETVIQPFDGHVAQTLDARLTIHFGFPKAHEDDALRAVSAGLGIASAIPTLNAAHRRSIRSLRRQSLNARIGVHTGEVIASDEGNPARPATVIGVAGTLANEAREIAAPGEVVITEDTYRLVKGFFNVQAMGAKPLPSSSKAVNLYHVVSRTAAANRIAAGAPFGLTEFVGRSEELSSLLHEWEAVKEGEARVVLLSGEAGVGKSRLIEALKSRLANTPHRLLEGGCSPYHQNSPLFPVVDLLRRTFDLDPAIPAGERTERLRKALARYRLSSAKDLHGLASFLSLPSLQDPRAGASQRQREDALGSLLKLFLRFASELPVLLVVEDLHWADPTTLDFLSEIVDRGSKARILTILTFRPDFISPWDQRADLNQFSLARLSHRESTLLVEHITHGKPLPQEVLKHVIANSDGIPLFIEELTKAVLESDVLQETEQGYELKTQMSPLSVPSTLRDSLMARLDRLGGAKEVAQLASVLGRTFSYEWLQSVASLGEPVLRRHLARLVEAGLLYQHGTAPAVTYTFKHGLIKDAAYFSLLNRVRQRCHERIARALERFPDIKETQPELLGHHYRDAGRTEKAVGYWGLAGHQAMARSATLEAAAHFRTALDLLRSLPETARRRQRQLDLIIALGRAQVATMGYAAVPVGEAFSRARELCGRVGDSPQLFDALQGLYAFHLVRADLKTSLELADGLIELAARLRDQPRGWEATLRRGISLYTLGDLNAAREQLEQAGTDLREPREIALQFGQDRIVASLSHLSVVSWLTGQPDRAVATGQEALARAQQLAHPFSLAFALLYAAIVRSFRNEPTAVQEHAVALANVCQEHGFAYRLAQSHILDGWSRATRDDDASAIPAIQLGIEKTRATGAQVLLPYYLALLTDACLLVRQIPLGLTSAREALAIVQRTGECFFQAELERLYGELLLVSGADPAETAAWFRKALATARRQRARSFELRAAMSLVHLAPDGSVERRQVADLLHLFDEGFDTPDLRAASELLQQSI